MPIRTIFFGTPTFAVPILQKLITIPELEVVLVVTQPDTAVGRKQILTPPPVKKVAERHQIPCFQPQTLKKPDTQAIIKDAQPELIVLAAYGKIIPQVILDLPKFKCLNIHPSALPKYRGATPIHSAILAGDSETAVSIMIMEPTLDTGPIVYQQKVAIPTDITYPELDEKLAHISAELLANIIPDWLAGKVHPQKQDDSLATYTKVLKKEDGRINWQQSAQQISQQIRAYTPWPGTFTTIENKRLKILQASAVGEHRLAPGEIKFMEGVILVGCADHSTLHITLLQEEGKQPMNSIQFIPGHLQWQGAKLA